MSAVGHTSGPCSLLCVLLPSAWNALCLELTLGLVEGGSEGVLRSVSIRIVQGRAVASLGTSGLGKFVVGLSSEVGGVGLVCAVRKVGDPTRLTFLIK